MSGVSKYGIQIPKSPNPPPPPSFQVAQCITLYGKNLDKILFQVRFCCWDRSLILSMQNRNTLDIPIPVPQQLFGLHSGIRNSVIA